MLIKGNIFVIFVSFFETWLSKFIMKTSHLGKCTVQSNVINVLHACASVAREFFSKFSFSVMSGPLVFLNNENELGVKCKGPHYCLLTILLINNCVYL